MANQTDFYYYVSYSKAVLRPPCSPTRRSYCKTPALDNQIRKVI
jgi:hypothetical protein